MRTLAFGLALGALAPAVAPRALVAQAADLMPGHALVVHAPSPSDPRYVRMRMEFAAIETVWRDAGVAFVGLFPDSAPETLGTMPDGLGTPVLRRTAPADAGFGVRLVRADGRLVHSSGTAMHRAVLLSMAMSGGEAAAEDRAAPPVGARPSAPSSAPRPLAAVASNVPVPTMRPRAVLASASPDPIAAAPIARPATPPAAPASTVSALGSGAAFPSDRAFAASAGQSDPGSPNRVASADDLMVPTVGAPGTTLDWGARPADAADDTPPPNGPVPVPQTRAVRVVGPPVDVAPPVASAPLAEPVSSPRTAVRSRPIPDPWGPWTTAPASPSDSALNAASDPAPVVPQETAHATARETAAPPTAMGTPLAFSPATLVPADPAPLAAMLPAATIERVRARLRAERLEGAKQNGFEMAGFDAALPLNVQARMRFKGGASLTGPDLGLALLVTRSCGASHPPARERRGFGGWFDW